MLRLLSVVSFLLGALSSLPAIEVTTFAGLGGAYEIGRWLPLRVSISSSDALDALLSVSIREGAVFGTPQSTVVYKAQALQARDSTRDYLFVVPSDTADPITVSLTSGERTLYAGSVDIRRFATQDRLVVGLSRRPSLDFLMGIPSTDPQAPFRVVYPLPETLPEKWLGYDGADLIVIHDVPGGLDERQIESIDEWVSAGGTLVVSGGSELTATDARRLASLLPVRLAGIAALRDPSPLARYTGAAPPASAPLLVSRVIPERGTVLLAAGGLPLIVKERHGNGTVYFLAFDYAQPPLDQWSGMRSLWSSILSGVADRSGRYSDFTIPDPFAGLRGATTRTATALSPVARLLAFERLPVPAVAAVALSLLGLCAAAAALAIARFGRASRFRWLGLTVLGTFGAGLLWFALGSNPRVTGPLLYTLSRIEAGSGSYGLVTQSLFVASPVAARIDIGISGTQSAVVPRAGDPLSLLETPAGMTIEDVTLDRWSYRNLTVLSMVRFPVEGSVTLADFAITVRVRNDTQRPIRDGYFLYRGVPYSTGTLAADQSITRTFPYAPGGDASRETNWQDGVRDERKIIILDYLLSSPAFEATRDGNSVVFVGWMDESPVDIAAHPPFSLERGMNVMMAVLHLEPT